MKSKNVSGSYQIIDEKAHKAKLTVCAGYDSNGKQIKKRRTVTYNKKTDIRELLRDFENEISSGHGAVGRDITLDQMMNDVIESKRKRGVRESTLHAYEAARKKIVAHFGEKKKATSLVGADVNAWIDELIESGLSSKTIKNYVMFLYTCYEDKIDDGILYMINPCRAARLPKQDSKQKQTLTLDQIGPFYNALHEYFDDYDLIVTYELALACGLRRSEILGLTWDAIDFNSKTLSVRQTRHLVDGQTYIEDTKTDNSKRTISVPDNILEDIRQLQLQHKTEMLKYGVRGYNDSFVIIDEFGQPMGADRVRQILRTFEKNAGFPNVTLHGLRHTYASMLNYFGTDLVEISSQLGHANKTITLDVYTHMFESATYVSKRIASNVNDFMLSASNG